MIRPIVHDEKFLSQKSDRATKADIQTITDLIDTLSFNAEHCVGMAANMIGVKKQIIVVRDGDSIFAMLNPRIIKQKGKYITEEGCLSLTGTRPCTRFNEITVEYLDANFKKKKGIFKDFPAQIIQHEIDHINGIII